METKVTENRATSIFDRVTDQSKSVYENIRHRLRDIKERIPTLIPNSTNQDTGTVESGL